MTASAFPDPGTTPEDERELLVVYPDAATADEARRVLVRAGVPEHDIRVDEDLDRVASLRAEMHDELERAWVVPTAGVGFTPEAAHGLLWLCAIGAVLGLIAGLLLALIPFGGSYGVRAIVLGVVGIACGLTIGGVAGPGLASTRPDQDLAAVHGSLLRVTHDSPELRRLLNDLGPLRIDELTADDVPVDTVRRETPTTPLDTAKGMRGNARGDDYHPPSQPS
jgi:hypothetical protein